MTKKGKKGNKKVKPEKKAPFTPEQKQKMVAEAEQYEQEVMIPEAQAEQAQNEAEFDEIIDSEDDLLKLFSDERYNLHVRYGEKLLKFTIKPIESSDDLSLLEVDKNIYSQFSKDEMNIIMKLARGEELSRQEQIIMNDAEARSRKDQADKSWDMIHDILSVYVTPPAFDNIKDEKKRIAKRREWWEHIAPFDLKTFVGFQVTDRLGLSATKMVKLFQGDPKLRREDNAEGVPESRLNASGIHKEEV